MSATTHCATGRGGSALSELPGSGAMASGGHGLITAVSCMDRTPGQRRARGLVDSYRSRTFDLRAPLL